MRKIILSLVAFSMFFAVGCSEESATDFNDAMPESNLKELAARSTAWNGEIGMEINGEYKITADENALKADLNSTLAKEGYNTTVQTLTIKKLISSNNPGDGGYMLVGSDNARTSIGVWLVRNSSLQFFSDTSFTNSTTCTGCAQGCNLSYVTIEGKKVAYCAENGCTYDCTKSESSY